MKVIDLSHKILIFLDTPSQEIFEALMSLLSHDNYEVEYQFVDTSNRTGLRTRTNVLIGWPSVIFAQALDYTRHPRYQEIQRRFIITNPRMDVEKYQSAIDLIIEKNCLPDLAFQKKVVSDENKNKAKGIILNIRDDLLSISSVIKPGKNNVLIPFSHLLKKIVSKNNTSQDMTFTNRIMNYTTLMANINFKKRPYFYIESIYNSDSFRIPLALPYDFVHTMFLVNNSVGGIRPYVLEWYQNIFLKLYYSKTTPNNKIKKEELIVEQRIAVTTQELIDKTKDIMNKTFTSKTILTEFIYPLLNLGYIDSIQSEIDKRAYIYFPVIDITEDKEIKYSNLFFLSKKNKLSEENNKNITSFIIKEDKDQIIYKIKEVMRYYSESGNLVTLRFADSDIEILEDDYDEDKTIEEMVDNYYSEFHVCNDISEKSEKKLDNSIIKEDTSKTSSSEEYLQTGKNDDVLQQSQENNIKNYDIKNDLSNKLFFLSKKNKLLYSCYWCEYQTDFQHEYEKHYVLSHPGKSGYPNMASIIKNGLKPKGKPWE